jgi:NADPH:quinone reductase and related Zn-dependent oxidoreductases
MERKAIISDKKGSMALITGQIGDPGAGEVQVRIHASVVSPGTERAFVNQMENAAAVWPFPVGYSAAGVITKVGENVKVYKAGDRVAGMLSHGSVENVDVSRIVKLPDNIDMDEAAFTHLGCITIQAVRKARIELGESVVVFGAGLIGLMAAQFAKANGAYPLIVLDKVESKLERAIGSGADYVVNVCEENWKERVEELTNGRGASVVIESTGFPQPVNDSLQIAARYGRVIILASTRGNTEVNFYRDVHKTGITIIGSHITTCPAYESYPGYWTFQDNYTAILNLLSAGMIHFSHIPSDKRSYREYKEIYGRVLSGDKDYTTTVIDWRDPV